MSWSGSQLNSGERRDTPWIASQPVAGHVLTNMHLRSHSRGNLESSNDLKPWFCDIGRKNEENMHTPHRQPRLEPGTS